MYVRRSSRSTAIRPWCGTRSSRCRCRVSWECRTSRACSAGFSPMPAGRGARVVRRSSRWPRATRRFRAVPCAGGNHQQIAFSRLTSRSPRWRRGMSRRRAFHDSTRLFVDGTGPAAASPSSRNMNGWPSRMRLRIMRRALTSLWCMSFTLPQSTTWFACT